VEARDGVAVKRRVAQTQKRLLRKVPVSIHVAGSASARAMVDAMKLKYIPGTYVCTPI